ncbi:MAG: PTS sugar transporter subunit IIA [Candidatus Marinimicrobia bacterium]|nr:PTS sugar transporter subunit IIA [Candidatus Neomarinimicrobiota bacterium]
MKLKPYFNLNAKALQSEAGSKADVLKEIAKSAIASETLKNVDPEHLYKKLREREAIGSTGFGDSIAIPHCTLDNIDSFVIGAITSKNGVDFKSLDGQSVKIFMYIIAPTKQRNEHIHILSEISKVLRIPSNIDTLLKQNSVKSFFDTFCDLGSWDVGEELPQEYAQMTVHIQDAKAFEKILEIYTEVEDCHISVLEGNNASKFLYALPLFSLFMNEERKGFHRLIVAVVNTVYINDSIRKINAICTELDCKSKVLITTHSLSYYNGGIDI